MNDLQEVWGQASKQSSFFKKYYFTFRKSLH